MENAKKIMLRPEGGTSINGVASAFIVIAVLVWVGGFIIGLVLGLGVGTVGYYMGGSRFSWGSAFLVWLAAFVMGLLPLGLAEIIGLLQKSVTIRYSMDTEEKAMQEKVLPNASVEVASEKVLPVAVEGSDGKVPFRLLSMKLKRVDASAARIALLLNPEQDVEISGVRGTVEFTTIFEETYTVPNAAFVRFRAVQGTRESDYMTCQIPERIMETIKSVKVNVEKYVYAGKIYVPGEKIEVNGASVTEEKAREFLQSARKYGSARELGKWVEYLGDKNQDPIASEGLKEMIRKCQRSEAYEGKGYEDTLKQLYSFFRLEAPSDLGQKVSPESVKEKTPAVSQNTNKEISQPEYLFCPKCGKKVEKAEAIFCSGCGARLSE